MEKWPAKHREKNTQQTSTTYEYKLRRWTGILLSRSRKHERKQHFQEKFTGLQTSTTVAARPRRKPGVISWIISSRHPRKCYGARQIVGELAGQRWYSEPFGLLISSGHRYRLVHLAVALLSALCSLLSALCSLLSALWLCSSGSLPCSVYAARFCMLRRIWIWKWRADLQPSRTTCCASPS